MIKLLTRESVLEIVRKRLNGSLGSLVFLWLYGSRKYGHDLDLLAVTTRTAKSNYRGEEQGIDFYEINQADFDRKINLFEPALTEAVVTGELIYGDLKLAMTLKEKFKNVLVDDEVCQYLREEAKKMLVDVRTFFARAVTSSFHNLPYEGSLYRCLVNLTFVLSYRAFADYYALHAKGVVTFNQIIDSRQFPLLILTVKDLKAVRRNKTVISFPLLREIVERIENQDVRLFFRPPTVYRE